MPIRKGCCLTLPRRAIQPITWALDDMEGSEVHKVRLTTKEGDMVYFYIDVQSFYVLKMVKRMKFKTKEDKSFVVYSDFRKNDFGLTLPYSTQRVDEKGNEQGGPVMLTKITVNPCFRQ
jgi:hypothetical protein